MHVRVAIAWPSVDPIALARTDGAWDTERDSHCSCCLHHLHEEEMLVWPGCTTSDRQLLSLARYIAFYGLWRYGLQACRLSYRLAAAELLHAGCFVHLPEQFRVRLVTRQAEQERPLAYSLVPAILRDNTGIVLS